MIIDTGELLTQGIVGTACGRDVPESEDTDEDKADGDAETDETIAVLLVR